MTGTLGSKAKRTLLKEMYNVSYNNVPTALPKKFTEHDTRLCDSVFSWKADISSSSIQIAKNHSVLIICENIKKAELLYNHIQQEVSKHAGISVFIYQRDYQEFTFGQTANGLTHGDIIATNLAGRGTDIKVSEQLHKAGGLHVILSYLPNNIQIEQQAFGRSA
jgi:preprotein translocase subunit SecA